VDEDGDGYLDLRVRLAASSLVVQDGATIAVTGALTTGRTFSGNDVVDLASGISACEP
jgi:hypothetical protein